jgi:uncharacterized protein YuzE
MKIEYDAEADAIYIQFREAAPGTVRNRQITDEIIADYGPDGKLVGIEILEASVVLGHDRGALTFEVADPRIASRA